MATRLQYRTNLSNKLLALEDGSYGDFEYETVQLDTFLDLSVARMFPAVYRRVSADALSLTDYGTAGMGYATDDTIVADRVFLVEDADELTPITGWEVRGDRIIGINSSLYSSVNVHFTDAYSLPVNDVDDAGIADIYEPLINLGALIEALEARQDTGVRGEPQPTGVFQETQLLDRLSPRYDKLRDQLAMSMPGMRF